MQPSPLLLSVITPAPRTIEAHEFSTQPLKPNSIASDGQATDGIPEKPVAQPIALAVGIPPQVDES